MFFSKIVCHATLIFFLLRKFGMSWQERTITWLISWKIERGKKKENRQPSWSKNTIKSLLTYAQIQAQFSNPNFGQMHSWLPVGKFQILAEVALITGSCLTFTAKRAREFRKLWHFLSYLMYRSLVIKCLPLLYMEKDNYWSGHFTRTAVDADHFGWQ